MALRTQAQGAPVVVGLCLLAVSLRQAGLHVCILQGIDQYILHWVVRRGSGTAGCGTYLGRR